MKNTRNATISSNNESNNSYLCVSNIITTLQFDLDIHEASLLQKYINSKDEIDVKGIIIEDVIGDKIKIRIENPCKVVFNKNFCTMSETIAIIMRNIKMEVEEEKERNMENISYNDTKKYTIPKSDYLYISKDKPPICGTITTNIQSWASSGANKGTIALKENIIDKKENNDMNKNKFFGNVQFGKLDTDKIAYSIKGIAFLNSNSEYIVYDEKGVGMNVRDFVINIPLFAMPVSHNSLKEGDIIIHNSKDNFVIIKKINEDSIEAIHPFTNEIIRIAPQTSIFGFSYYTKVIMPLGTDFAANSDNPFGNLLPLIAMSEDSNDILPFMLMMNGGETDMKSILPFMMNKGDNNMLALMMMNGFDFNKKN